MLIDCTICQVRGAACGDCVVTALLGEEQAPVCWDETEQRAIDALVAGGVVSPLRLVPVVSATEHGRGLRNDTDSDEVASGGPVSRVERANRAATPVSPSRRRVG